jgi:hypothetical protein
MGDEMRKRAVEDFGHRPVRVAREAVEPDRRRNHPDFGGDSARARVAALHVVRIRAPADAWIQVQVVAMPRSADPVADGGSLIRRAEPLRIGTSA